MSPRGIVIVAMNYAPEIAGVGRYTGEIGTYLADLGGDVRVVTTPPHYPGWSAKPGHSARGWTRQYLGGATVYRCPLYLHPDMRGLRRLFAPFSFALTSAPVTFWQIIRRRPEIVLVVEPTLLVAPVALLAARLVGARTILHVQDLEVDAAFAMGHLSVHGVGGGTVARIAGWFDRRMTRSFDHVITIAGRMRERLIAKGAAVERTSIVRNWVDLARIVPLEGPSRYRLELGLAEGAFVVLYAGNIGAKQGIRLLLDAAERLGDQQHILFIVAGEGPMSDAVDSAARKLPNLRRLPFQPEERLGEFLGLADLHVLPQEREAADLLLPSKLGGMLASGRRIVVTADNGTELAEFLGEACTFVPPGNAAALAKAIERLSRLPDEPAAMAARLRLAQSLDKTEGLAKFARVALGACDPLSGQGAASPNERGQGPGARAAVAATQMATGATPESRRSSQAGWPGMRVASSVRASYEHPHVRMARQRRRAHLKRRLAVAAVILMVTTVAVSAAMFLAELAQPQ